MVWMRSVIYLITFAAIPLCGCNKQSNFSTSTTVEVDKDSPIPPTPVTGGYLTGDIFRSDGSAAANGVLDIVDEVRGTVAFSVNLSDQGDFSLPLSKVLSAALALRITDQEKHIYSVVSLPADIVQSINRIKIAAGEPILADSSRPQGDVQESSGLSLNRRMSLQLPANSIIDSGTAALVWQSDRLQTVSSASLPLKINSIADSALLWTQVENKSDESGVLFAWKNEGSRAQSVKIVFSEDEAQLSGWDGKSDSIPAWSGRSPQDYVISDFAQCTLRRAGQHPVGGELSVAAGDGCGIRRGSNVFPFSTGKDFFARAVAQSAAAVRLSPVFRVPANSQGPQISAIADQLVAQNSGISNLPISVVDPDSDLSCTASLSASSSNEILIPNRNIYFSGSFPNCRVNITPASNQTGVSTIVVLASDGQHSSTAVFTVGVDSPIEKKLVLGQIDEIRGAAIGGWTCQQNTEKSLNIEVYAKGIDNSGILIATGRADRVSESEVGVNCNSSLGKHRFLIPIPANYAKAFVGAPLFIKALDAINTDARWSAVLQGSGSFSIPSGNTVIGRIDIVAADRIEGWACQRWNENSIAIDVKATFNGQFANDIASGIANKDSEEEIGIMCGTTSGKHRFVVPLDSGTSITYSGAIISVVGIDGLTANKQFTALIERSGELALP
jgi:hypothetical protein